MTARAFTTERLALRPHVAEDFAASLSLWSDPAVTRHITGRPSTREEVWARLLRYVGHWNALGYGYWVVTERAGGRFVGEVGFADHRRDMRPALAEPEAGWVLVQAASGRGYATEALAGALAWADAAMRWPRVACIIAPANVPSVRVARKAGFAPRGAAEYRGETIEVYERRCP